MVWNSPELLNHLEVGLLVVDADGCVRVWNRWLERHATLAIDSVMGRPLVDSCPDVAGSRLEMAIHSALTQKLASLLSPGINRPVLPLYQRPVDALGDLRMQQMLHVIPLPGEPRSCLVQVIDMTASARREQQLRNRPFRDALTGLFNRRRFDEVIAVEFRRAVEEEAPIALLMVDVDHFKRYRDRFGNAQGDACLKAIATALRASLADQPEGLARYDEDRFALIIGGLGGDDVCKIAEHARTSVAAALADDPHRAVTVSIGVACLTAGGHSDCDSLISGAQMAVYQAKSDGRNRVSLFSLDDGALSTLPRN